MITEEGSKIMISSFQRETLTSDLFEMNGVYGCDFYKDGVLIATELFGGKSVHYAQSAAENYVDGIKQV
jgi:hypothetical protein